MVGSASCSATAQDGIDNNAVFLVQAFQDTAVALTFDHPANGLHQAAPAVFFGDFQHLFHRWLQ